MKNKDELKVIIKIKLLKILKNTLWTFSVVGVIMLVIWAILRIGVNLNKWS